MKSASECSFPSLFYTVTMGRPGFLYGSPIFKPLSRHNGLLKARTCHQRPTHLSPVVRAPHATLQTVGEHQEEDLGTIETFRVIPDEAGMRIDKLIAQRFNEKSRTYIQTLLSSSCVAVDDHETTTKSARVSTHQLITVRFLPQQRDLPLMGEPIALDILHEDAHVVVVNKPAGMVVHPAPGNWTGTLVHALCHQYDDIAALGGPRPGIVHRLDKGTSGVIAVARTSEAHAALCEQFAARGVQKEYAAITVGNPAGPGCVGRVINASIGRSPTDRLRMAVLADEDGGKAATTTMETVGHDASGLLHAVRVRISTGRTHQIRVHMRHVRTPVLGDDLYGAHDINRRFASAATRPMLHAVRIAFTHPVTGLAVDVTAPLADDIRQILRRVVYPSFAEQPGWR